MTVAVALVLGGCGNSSDDSSGPSDSSSSSSSSGGTSDSDQDSSDDSTYDDTAEAETTSEEPTDVLAQSQREAAHALEAELDATTDCEVDMGGSAWMPLDVTVTAVTPVGIEYQVMPSLGG